MLNAQKYRREIKALKIDILLHPESKHRIILRVIKSAKTKELGRLIRTYNKRKLL